MVTLVNARTSTQDDAKEALETRLKQRANFRNSGVLISWGVPPGDPPNEWILLGDIEGSQQSDTIGNERRVEVYRIKVSISVLSRQNQKSATKRAYTLARELEEALRDDASLGGVVTAAVIGGPEDEPGEFSLREAHDAGNWEAELTIDVRCRARI